MVKGRDRLLHQYSFQDSSLAAMLNKKRNESIAFFTRYFQLFVFISNLDFCLIKSDIGCSRGSFKDFMSGERPHFVVDFMY